MCLRVRFRFFIFSLFFFFFSRFFFRFFSPPVYEQRGHEGHGLDTFVENPPADAAQNLRGDKGVVEDGGEELVGRLRQVEEVWDDNGSQDGIRRGGPETCQLALWGEAT